MRNLFVVISALFCNLSAYASQDPITDEMISEGLAAYSRGCSSNEDYLAPLRKSGERASMESASRVTLHARSVKTPQGGVFPFLVLNVTNRMAGTIIFFRWDVSKTARNNYRVIDQLMYKTGSFSHYNGDKRLGSLTYSFNHANENQRMCYIPKVGYYPASTALAPFIYCYLSHYTVAEAYRNMGLGTAFVDELMEFAFQSTSADFIAASVAEDNIPSRKVFLKSGFLQVKSILDKEAPGYDRETCVGRSTLTSVLMVR